MIPEKLIHGVVPVEIDNYCRKRINLLLLQ
jgi:hypothetical protein